MGDFCPSNLRGCFVNQATFAWDLFNWKKDALNQDVFEDLSLDMADQGSNTIKDIV